MNIFQKILYKFKKKEQKRNVLSINFDDIKPFKGVSYTTAEGQKMSQNRHTELPEFRIKL